MSVSSNSSGCPNDGKRITKMWDVNELAMCVCAPIVRCTNDNESTKGWGTVTRCAYVHQWLGAPMVVKVQMGGVGTMMWARAPMVRCTNSGDCTNGWYRNYDMRMCTNGEITNGGECTNGWCVNYDVCAPMVSCTNGDDCTNGWGGNYDVSMCTNGEITNGGECTNGWCVNYDVCVHQW